MSSRTSRPRASTWSRGRPAQLPGPRQLPSLRMCRPPSLASMGTCLAREDGEHDGSDRSAPEPGPTGDTADARGLRGVPGSRVPVGAPAAVPYLRARGLLRFLAAAARARARLRGLAPDRRVVQAGGVLALVLCRRSLRLSLHRPCPGTSRKPLTCT